MLELGNYYKRFIKSYCVIIAPLQELLIKSVHFRWDDEQEYGFHKLKEALCKAPVLAYPDPNLPYVVDTDASNLAIVVWFQSLLRFTTMMVYDKKRTFRYNSF